MKNVTAQTTKSQSNSAPLSDPKAQLKALAEQQKALREQVKAAQAAAKESKKAESKEVTLRWISNFTDRITRLETKRAKAIELRQGLIERAKKNGWVA